MKATSPRIAAPGGRLACARLHRFSAPTWRGGPRVCAQQGEGPSHQYRPRSLPSRATERSGVNGYSSLSAVSCEHHGGTDLCRWALKFEPKELERTLLPRLEEIHGYLTKSETAPERWTKAKLASEAVIAKDAFRHERLLNRSILQSVLRYVLHYLPQVIGKLPDVAAEPVDAALIADLMDGRDARKAFRYLTAPPISEDDLKTVADAALTPSRLRTDLSSAKRIRDTVLTIIDPHRFPWIAKGRGPSNDERERAVIASAPSRRRATWKQAAAVPPRRRRSRR